MHLGTRTVDPNLGKQRQLYIPKFPRMARDVFYVIDQRLKTNYTVDVMPEHARSFRSLVTPVLPRPENWLRGNKL
jgi:hypothetical protein